MSTTYHELLTNLLTGVSGRWYLHGYRVDALRKGRSRMTMLGLGPQVKEIQGERIKRARTWVALSQKELAAEVSWLTDTPISHNIISQIEQGNRDATTREMRAIATVTGQDRDWLEGFDGDFDASVETATLNRVIPGYHNRLWLREVIPSTVGFPLPPLAAAV